MKINFFIRFIILASFFAIWGESNVIVDSTASMQEYFRNSSSLKKSILRTFDSNSSNFRRLTDTILKSENVLALAFDKSYFIIVSLDSLKLFKLDSNMNIIDQIETDDFNHINITSVGISAIKQIMVAVNRENDIFLFDISKDRFKLIDSYLGDGRIANFVTCSADGSKLAVINHQSNTVCLFDINDAIISKVSTIFTGLESGPLTAQFSENADHLGILCNKQNSIEVFSQLENVWKLTESIAVKNDQFLYFFDRDKLVVDYQEMVCSDAENKTADNIIDNVVASEVSDEAKQLVDNLSHRVESENVSVGIHKQDNINLTLTSKSRTLTKTSRPLIKGKTSPNQKVQIYINDNFLDEVISNTSGTFNYRVKNSLPNGSYVFNAKIQLNSSYVSSNQIKFRINKHYPLKGSNRRKR